MNLSIPMPQLKNKINLQDLLAQQAQQMPQDMQPIQDVQSTEPVVQESGKMGTMQKIALALAAVAAAKGKTNPLQMMLATQIGQGDAQRRKVQDDLNKMLKESQIGKNEAVIQKPIKLGNKLYTPSGELIVDAGNTTFEISKDGTSVIWLDPKTGTSRVEPIAEFKNRFIKDGEIVEETVSSKGTTQEVTGLTPKGETEKALKESQTEVNKQRLETEKARVENWRKSQQATARKIAMAEMKASGFEMNSKQQDDLTDANWIIDLTEQIENDLSTDKELQTFVGNDLGAWFKRGTRTEFGSWVFPDMPPNAVDFFNKIGQLRDIVQRSRTGAAMPETERAFYEELLGGKQYSPQALTQKMKSTRGIVNTFKDSMFQTVKTNTGLKTGEIGISEGGKLVPGKPIEGTQASTGKNTFTISDWKSAISSGDVKKLEEMGVTQAEIDEFEKTKKVPERFKKITPDTIGATVSGKINSPTVQRPSEPLTASASLDAPVESTSMNISSLPFDSVRANVPRSDVGLDKPVTFEIPETVKDIIPLDIPLDNVVVSLIKKTTKIIGPIPVQNNIVTVTQKSLEDASRPNGKYSIVIDPNTNTAVLKNPDNVTVKEFAIGTGDTTGLRQGKKYFTPTGTFSVREKNEEKGKYAPFWMEFKRGVFSDYGMHGPYEDEKKVVKDGKFINEGYVSQGCVRFKTEDLKEVAKYLKLGSKITVLPYKMKPSQSFNPEIQ